MGELISSTKPDLNLAAQEIVISNQTAATTLSTGTYANVGNGFSITIPKTGKYKIKCFFVGDIDWTTNDANSFIFRLANNGSAIVGTEGRYYKDMNNAGISRIIAPVCVESPIATFSSGDVITLQAYKSNTDAVRISYSAGLAAGYIQAEQVEGYVITRPDITEWKSYTLNIGAVTTAPTKGTIERDAAYYRLVGTNLEVMYTFRQSTAGASGSGLYLFPIPSGYTIDTSKTGTVVAPSYNAEAHVGSGTCYNGSNTYPMTAHVYDTGNLTLMYDSPASVISDIAMGLGSAATIVISYVASIPIV